MLKATIAINSVVAQQIDSAFARKTELVLTFTQRPLTSAEIIELQEMNAVLARFGEQVFSIAKAMQSAESEQPLH